MTDGERDPSPKGKPGLPEIDPTLRAVAAASVGGTLIIWWPAFTLGAYGTIFFDHVLALWAVATAVLFSGVILRSRGALPWSGRAALSLPTIWIFVAAAAPKRHGWTYVHYFEAALTLVAAPVLTWLLTRVLVPDYAELPGLQRLGAVVVTVAVGVLAFLLGKFNYLFLTCGDFVVSGNDRPPSCISGPPFHVP